MGSSKTKFSSHEVTDMGGFAPYKQPLADQIPRLQQASANMENSPLVNSARDYMTKAASGGFADLSQNPYWKGFSDTISGDTMARLSAQMGMAGRGNMSGGDVQQNLGRGVSSTLAQAAMPFVSQERGFQDQAARSAPAFNVASYGAPSEWLQGQLIGGAQTGQSGTRDVSGQSSTTPSIGQQIMGGLMMAGQLASGGMSGLLGGAAPFSSMGGLVSGMSAPAGQLPWQSSWKFPWQ